MPAREPQDNTGLSLGYRFLWRLQYVGLSVLGPAGRPSHADPRKNLRRERARRVIAAHAEQGTQPPAEVLRIAVEGR